MTTPAQTARVATVGQTQVVLIVLAVVVATQRWLVPRLDSPALQTWSTIFVAMVLQALPFLVGGVLLAAAISATVSEDLLRRVVPRNPVLGVPVAGIAGAAIPGCECTSVPVAGSLVRRGVAPAVALTFMLAAPAINPIVLVSTAVAFGGRLEIVGGRFLASLVTAVAIGWIWHLAGRGVPLTSRGPIHPPGTSRWSAFVATARHDFLHAGGFLVLGAMIAAAISTFVPRDVLDTVAGSVVLSIVGLAVFAFVIAMCSEADAFVAASLTMFSDTAKLVFMVVGPAMDVKLAAMTTGQFGGRFALRFVPLVVVVAVASASVVGWWLL